MVYVHIVLFLIFQIAANLVFKWSSFDPHLYWWGFIGGNLIGVTSIIFFLGMYQALPAATVLAIGTGGSFLLTQIAMYLVYHEKISRGAMVGIAMIFAGILLVAFLNNPQETKKNAETQTEQPVSPDHSA